MSRYINADALENAMYNKAFETDTELQRWDSGCWIRYKLFETVLEEQPTADVVEVVRCKDCKHYSADGWGYGNCYRRSVEYLRMEDNGFCSFGERIEENV